jgi:tRNA(Ile)-lysidine synthase TilS/MesJ
VVDRAGFPPVTDPSNTDLDYERVRWRQMLPQLAALGLDSPAGSAGSPSAWARPKRRSSA